MKNCILLVEDNDLLRNTIKQLLEAHGFKVITAENGKQALDKLGIVRPLKQMHPYLIITDLQMPVMDGHELIKNLDRDSFLSTIPVLVCSSEDPRLAPVGKPYIEKPVGLHALIKKVEEMTRASSVARSLA